MAAWRFGLMVSTCQRDTQPRRRKFNKLLEFTDSNKAGRTSGYVCTINVRQQLPDLPDGGFFCSVFADFEFPVVSLLSR
jgi:hypothetical protein